MTRDRDAQVPIATVTSIEPLIRRRKQRACPHDHVQVSFEEAELECIDCGAALDPWSYIRQMAKQDDAYRAYQDKLRLETEELIERYNTTVHTAQEHIARLNADIHALVETKNRLVNERVGDRLLGHITRRPKRRGKTT